MKASASAPVHWYPKLTCIGLHVAGTGSSGEGSERRGLENNGLNEQPSEWIGEQVESVSKQVIEREREMLNEKDKIGGKKKERKKKDLAYYVTNHFYLEIQWIKS